MELRWWISFASSVGSQLSTTTDWCWCVLKILCNIWSDHHTQKKQTNNQTNQNHTILGKLAVVNAYLQQDKLLMLLSLGIKLTSCISSVTAIDTDGLTGWKINSVVPANANCVVGHQNTFDLGKHFKLGNVCIFRKTYIWSCLNFLSLPKTVCILF